MMSDRKTLYCFAVLSATVLLHLPGTTQAASVASSTIENNGEWTIGTTSVLFTGATAGITPTTGSLVMHFNNQIPEWSGTNFIVFGPTLTTGTYTATIDVGNYNNRPMATIGDIGMTVGGTQPGTVGTLLTPDTSSTPSPASGAIEQWSFTYNILAGNPNLGSAIGFAITVPFTGGLGNVAFDNLNIDFAASAVPLPTGAWMGLIMLGGLGIKQLVHRRLAA